MLDQIAPILRPVRFLSTEAQTLPDLFMKRAVASSERIAYSQKVNGQWAKTTWRQFYDQAASLATFLMARGLASGDKVCIMGSTRAEWVIGDMGGQLAGVVTVGAYPTVSAPQLQYIIDHSDTRIAFVEGREEVEKLLAVRSALPRLEAVVVWRYDDLPAALKSDGWLVPFSDAVTTKADKAAIDVRVAAIEPTATAIIVYTSGTTGPPKGAMISHANIMALLRGLQNYTPFDADDVSLNFLPMAHVAERIVGFYVRIDVGIACAYASSVQAVLEEVQEVRPNVFGSVPRIFEKAYAKIMSEVSKAPPAKQRVFRYAERVGRDVVKHWQKGEPIPLPLLLQYKLVDKLVFSKLRNVFGGRVKHFVTGAAPIAYEILEFFWAAGFPIFEVYGMTEATVITHGTRPGAVRLGTVGKHLDMIEERLADDGEILLRGPTIFKGYYKNPEATAEAVDAEGWLHTGDVGKLDADGFLRIVDRKKHIIITAGGKNITPANIEQEVKGHEPLISQVHAHGDRRPYLTALVTVHPIEAIEWARGKGLLPDPAKATAIVTELTGNPLARPAGLEEVMRIVTSHPEVRDRIVAAVRKANAALSKVETIKKVYLLDRDFSVNEDEVTPTLKVKRKEVEKKFAPIFDKLYAEKGFGFAVSEEASAV